MSAMPNLERKVLKIVTMYRVFVYFMIIPHNISLIDCSNAEKFGIDVNANNKMKYFVDILAILNNYNVIIHVDNGSAYTANTFVSTHRSNLVSLIMIYNHDHMKHRLQRPPGGTFLNIILTDSSKVSTYFQEKQNLKGVDVVMFITYRIDIDLSTAGDTQFSIVKRAGNIIIAQVLTDIRVYKMCYYCGAESKIFRLLEISKNNTVNIDAKDLVADEFKNLKGHELSIIFHDYYPYVYCIGQEEFKEQRKGVHSCVNTTGVESQLVEAISKVMNFTFKFIKFDRNMTTTNALLNHLREDTFHVAIGGLSLTAERVKRYPYSWLLQFEDIVLMFQYQHPIIDNLFTFSYVLSLNVVMLLTIAVMLGAFVLCIVLRIMYQKKVSVGESMEVLLRISIEQPLLPMVVRGHVAIPIFLLLSFWMLTCIQINTAYKSYLTSHIIHPPKKVIDDVYELIEEGYDIVVDASKFPLLNMLLNGSGVNLKRIVRHFIRKSNLCEAIAYSIKNRVAVMGEFSLLYYHSQLECFDGNDIFFEKLSFTSNPLTKSSHGWYFEDSIPFDEAIYHQIQRMRLGGLVNKWMDDMLYKGQLRISPRHILKYNDASDTMKSFTSHFTLYIIGITLSITVFAIEILWKIHSP